MPRFTLNAREFQLREEGKTLCSSYQLVSIAQISEAPIDKYLTARLNGNEFARYAQGFIEALIALEENQFTFDYQIAEKLGKQGIQAEEAEITSGTDFIRTIKMDDGCEEYHGSSIISIDLYPSGEFQ